MRKLAVKLLDFGYKVPVKGGLSEQFKHERVRFKTVQQILDFLGYEIVIREKQK